MAWIYLAVAGSLEVLWAVGLKYTYGFTRFWPSVWTLAVMSLSFFFLSQAVRTLPIGTAYAIWTGIGAVGTACLGMIFLKEPFSFMRVLWIALIVIGMAGLKLSK